jgi:hypothetical protein
MIESNPNKLTPIKANQDKGFHYTVTDEQISEHQKRTIPEIFEWIESTMKFVSRIQTPEEKLRSIVAKNII